jgi:hypothetical protein
MPALTSAIAARGEGGSCGHQKCTDGWWLGHVLRHQPRLGRLGRRAKAVQVQKVGGGHVVGIRAITGCTADWQA